VSGDLETMEWASPLVFEFKGNNFSTGVRLGLSMNIAVIAFPS